MMPPSLKISAAQVCVLLPFTLGAVGVDDDRVEGAVGVDEVVSEVRCCVVDARACPLMRLVDCKGETPSRGPLPTEPFEFTLDENEAGDPNAVFSRGSRADRIRFMARMPEVERVVVVQPYGVSSITAPDNTQETLCLSVVLDTILGPRLPGAEFVTAGGPAPGAARTSHAPVCVLGVPQLVVLGRAPGWSAPLAMGSDRETIVGGSPGRQALLDAAKETLRAALGAGQ